MRIDLFCNYLLVAVLIGRGPMGLEIWRLFAACHQARMVIGVKFAGFAGFAVLFGVAGA